MCTLMSVLRGPGRTSADIASVRFRETVICPGPGKTGVNIFCVRVVNVDIEDSVLKIDFIARNLKISSKYAPLIW